MAEYKFTSDQADAITYQSENAPDGKKYLTEWLNAKTFGKGGDVTLCRTPDASVTLKLPLAVVEDDKNWSSGKFILPATALEMTAQAASADECFAVVRKALRSIGPSLFTDLVHRRDDGNGEFIVVQVDESDKSKWSLVQ